MFFVKPTGRGVGRTGGAGAGGSRVLSPGTGQATFQVTKGPALLLLFLLLLLFPLLRRGGFVPR